MVSERDFSANLFHCYEAILNRHTPLNSVFKNKLEKNVNTSKVLKFCACHTSALVQKSVMGTAPFLLCFQLFDYLSSFVSFVICHKNFH